MRRSVLFLSHRTCDCQDLHSHQSWHASAGNMAASVRPTEATRHPVRNVPSCLEVTLLRKGSWDQHAWTDSFCLDEQEGLWISYRRQKQERWRWKGMKPPIVSKDKVREWAQERHTAWLCTLMTKLFDGAAWSCGLNLNFFRYCSYSYDNIWFVWKLGYILLRF